jgi:hypothetical protein
VLVPKPGTKPFGSLRGLALALGLNEARLQHVVAHRDDFWIPGKAEKKKDGTPRVTHNATPELKHIHEQIKVKILRKVAYPPYLYGGLPALYEGDARHNIANAQQHVHGGITIALDISNFFPSTTELVVNQIWRRLFRQPPSVADCLTRLTTYQNMLPQGWKTSSYLAALALWDVEPEIEARLREAGNVYTRFVDDITVSSATHMTKAGQREIIGGIAAILTKKGLRIKRSKLVIAARGGVAEVTGVRLKAGAIRFSRTRYRMLRAEIQEFCTNSNMSEEERISRRRSFMGQIDYVRRLSSTQAEALRRLLSKS